VLHSPKPGTGTYVHVVANGDTVTAIQYCSVANDAIVSNSDIFRRSNFCASIDITIPANLHTKSPVNTLTQMMGWQISRKPEYPEL
jgi:hypothetical protein